MNVFWVVLILLALLLFIVILSYIDEYSTTIITSRLSKPPINAVADQYYFLPQGHLTLTVTATIRVDKTIAGNRVVNDKLLQLDFKPVVQIKPDPNALVAVSYKPNRFSNDELQIISSSSALLQSVKAVTEDRLGNIVAQIVQAPAKRDMALIKARTDSAVAAEKIKTEIIEVTRVFHIDNDELAGGEIKKEWKIPLPGFHQNTARETDASFTLTTGQKFSKTGIDGIEEFSGLFTRPLIAQEWKLVKNGTASVSFVCMVPDKSSVIKVPVRRSYFIKKQQLPKFEQGMLIENSINKPSEIEGLVSIPINILKAVMSIPAQLFQFKISRVKQETELEKALIELQKAKAEADQLAHAVTVQKLEDEKEALRKIIQQNELAADEIEIADEGIPQLGKLPPLKFEDIRKKVKPDAVTDDIAAVAFTLPAIKEPHSWADKNNIWDHYNNFDFKTCVPASAAYLLTSWTSNTTAAIFISRTTVMDTLIELAPGHDIKNGCHLLKMLEHWRTKGIEGFKINDYQVIIEKDTAILKQAIYCFGGCLVGLQLPGSLRTKSEWRFDVSLNGESKERHAVCAIGFDGNDFKVISFGRVITMDAAFYEKFNDETYVVLSREFWTRGSIDQSPTEPPFKYETLEELAVELSA